MGLGMRLKIARQSKRISQQRAANELKNNFGLSDMNRSKIANWELGRAKPDQYTIQVLAKYYNITVETLTGAYGTPDISQEDKQRIEEAIRDLELKITVLKDLLLKAYS